MVPPRFRGRCCREHDVAGFIGDDAATLAVLITMPHCGHTSKLPLAVNWHLPHFIVTLSIDGVPALERLAKLPELLERLGAAVPK